MTSTIRKIIPIYTSKGDAEGFLVYPYLYNRSGEWIGFITSKKEIYSVMGYYVGMLADGPRIIGKRVTNSLKPHLKPPPAPSKVYPPATIPLAPMMSDLPPGLIDILLEEPERLHTIDSGELRPDIE